MSRELDQTSVGGRLAAAREARKWTLEEAAKRTKIKPDALKKLEADLFDDLPSIAYARGFVRIYANELGLDAWSLLRDFDGSTDDELDLSDLQPEDLESIPKKKQPAKANAQAAGLVLIMLFALGIVAVLGVKLYQVSSEVFPDESSPLKDIAKVEIIENPEEIKQEDGGDIRVAKAKAVTTPKASPAVPMVAKAVATAIHSLRLSVDPNVEMKRRWARVTGVTADKQEILFEGHLEEGKTLPPPEYQPWKADEFIIIVSDGSVVDINWNGTNLGKSKNGPIRLTLPQQ